MTCTQWPCCHDVLSLVFSRHRQTTRSHARRQYMGQVANIRTVHSLLQLITSRINQRGPRRHVVRPSVHNRTNRISLLNYTPRYTYGTQSAIELGWTSSVRAACKKRRSNLHSVESTSGDLSGWFRHSTFEWTHLDLKSGFCVLAHTEST